MNKIALSVLLCLFPALLFAADGSALSFAPPPSDYSVIFLGNLFGVVDGILHGSGSQIMGSMFAVFNSAVLALGGIIILYTLLVSTMNTAHEGEMLGKKWSSIWIPVRSTVGLALLIPKASGYCLMQIFVMWIVVQGIGAADKVWDAALGYLNRGGVIIKAQPNPADALTASSDGGISDGAMTILSGQVCMLGLQNQLTAQRQEYLDQLQNDTGPCYGNPSTAMKSFCSTAVPDFMATVNAVVTQNANKDALNFSTPMPNFDSTSQFAFLNGICGTIKWNSLNNTLSSNAPRTQPATNNKPSSTSGGSAPRSTPNSTSLYDQLTPSQLQTAQMSRAIAIQQMYLTLSTVAQIMVNNDPSLTKLNTGNVVNHFSLVAKQQFGVPYTAQSAVCNNYAEKCELWGPLTTSTGVNSAMLFNGTEFLGAITDYNAIMAPTVNLINQAATYSNDDNSREFINKASKEGWIMAGSYFFDLVRLNGNALTDNNKVDTNTGLEKSTFDVTTLLSPFGTNKSCVGQYALLCTWFGADSAPLNQVGALINGSMLTTKNGVPVAGDPVAKPDLKPNDQRKLVGNEQSSTVYGFINNSVMVQLPGQPGIAPMEFANMMKFSVSTEMYYLPKQDFDCGKVKIIFFSICMGRMFGELFYNAILRHLYNFFLNLISQLVQQIVMAFLMVPLEGMKEIFKLGLRIVSEPGVNPIVALSNMGQMYINFSANLWIMLLNLSISIGILLPFMFALILMIMPLLLAWIGVMVSVGFVTAYYIPILPYMIFTFGTIAWVISVIEAMVAAPLVALGVTHPDGQHEVFGKGEAAIMILMNVFLRPAMMIIGYIAAISLSYVGVWILNAGFDNAIGFIQTGNYDIDNKGGFWKNMNPQFQMESVNKSNSLPSTGGAGTGGYTEWAGIYAYFFSILIYTTIYLTIVQKAFTLISVLPDKVLRWIGGSPESAGQEAAGWGEELKGGVKEAGGKTLDAQEQMGKKLGAAGGKVISGAASKAKEMMKGGGSVESQGSNSADEEGGGKGKKP